MDKEETIRRYGEEAWQKKLGQQRAWAKAHREEVEAIQHEANRKGGKYYEKHLKDNRTGLQGERKRIRMKHAMQYKPYKDIIAPDSQIHHEWVPKTADYRGVALVEKEAHQYGFVDVIEILDGKITLLTEAEVKKKGGKEMDVQKKIEGRVTAWGIRLQVPAPVIKGIELAVDDEVIWTIEERKGKKVAVLSKKGDGKG